MSNRHLPLWARLHVHWYQDKKLLGAHSDSKLLYAQAMGWCRDQMTDGEVPATALPIVGVDLAGDPLTAAERLVERGAWERTAAGYRYPAAAWAKWQETAAEVTDRRAAEAQRLREYRAKKRAAADANGDEA